LGGGGGGSFVDVVFLELGEFMLKDLRDAELQSTSRVDYKSSY